MSLGGEILLIEAEDAVRRALAASLRGRHHGVSECQRISEARALLDAGARYDVVVLGADTEGDPAAFVRHNRDVGGPPVVLLAMPAQPPGDSGLALVLSRPVPGPIIAERIEGIMQRRTPRRPDAHAVTIPPGSMPPERQVIMASVLLVEPDQAQRAMLRTLGQAHLFEVVCATDTAGALKALDRGVRFDAAIVGSGAGLEVARALREADPRLPIACVSGSMTLHDRVAAVHAGASLFLPPPLSGEAFVNAVRQLQALSLEESPRVLLVSDNAAVANELVDLLETDGLDVSWLPEPRRVLQLLPEVQADLLIVQAGMEGLADTELTSMLRATTRWQALPILVLARRPSPEARLRAFQAGADDFLPLPCPAAELLAILRVRLARARLNRERADRDPLTGLLVRRAFNDTLVGWLAEARRNRAPLALCLIDVDRFKRVNDTFGHLAGDRVLVGLGSLLSRSFRTEDLRGRWGGEEFVVAFDREDMHSAREIMDRARREFGEMKFRGDHDEHFRCSFSAGIACSPHDGNRMEQLLRVADRRLYAAKASGRNRVVAAVY